MAHGASNSNFNSIQVLWRLWLALALIVVGSYLAFTQPLRPNPYTPPSSLWPWQADPAQPGQKHWDISAWLEPIETNAYWRLPVLSFGNSFFNLLRDIHLAADGHRLWAVGDNGAIFHSNNGGQEWQPQASGTIATLWSVAFQVDGEHGWAVGNSGTILTTRNGGQEWQPQASGTIDTLWSVAFQADGEHGWAVGESGTILTTRNGGQEWQPQTSGTKDALWSVAFQVDGEHGWAVGEKGTILTTRNGGQEWQPQTSGTKDALLSVAFQADGEHGWVVGESGTILTTRNGGQEWQPQTSGTEVSLRSVAFQADGEHGWVVGESGTILTTRNGGQEWQPQTSGTEVSLRSVAFQADGEHGWTVGSNGTILTTRNGGQNWRTAITLHSRWPAPGYYFCLLLAAVLLWGLPFWTPPSITLPKQDKDQPWQPGEADRMAFQPIAEALSQLLAYEDTQPPLTVGITADWGRGKSSLMNMLKQRLEAESYRCVFYNAWHQQDEAQVLKSLLESVRQQLIPGFLTLRGLRLRRRLLWGRDGIPKFSFVLGLLGLLYFVAQPSLDLLSVKIVNPELKLADYRDWLFEQRGWQQAVMLTERDIEKLCKDDSHKAAETPAFSPADCLAISQHLTWAAPVPKTQRANHPPPINSSTEKPESKRRPPKTANANSKDEKSASLAKPEIAATAPGKVPAEFEAAMGCARKYEALRPCEFASVDALQATVAEVLGHDKILTNEQKQALTQIHSRLPNATSEHVQLMVSGILGCLAMMLLALLYTEITVLGENRLVKLFKPLLDKLSLDWTSLEAAGQHQLHRERFASLLNVLEPQQLVIFIDDLDRCQQQQAAKVLEVVNFLSSAHPSCFFVLGFYPEYLKACVGLNFSEIAKEMIKEKVAPGIDKDEEEQQEREVFAHHYLQKLINIEAPVPKPQAQHIHAMLKEPENGDNNSWQALVDYFRTRWKNTLKSINYLPVASLGLLILAVAGLWIYQPSPAQPAKAYKIFEAPTAIVATPPKPKDPDSPIEKERNQDNRASVTPAAPEDATALLTVPILASGLALLGLLLLLRRQPQWFEDRWGFALIFRLLNHFWPNPIKRQDSKRFQHALLHWHEVISLKTDAPRSLKAFKNRARYFAVLAEALYRNNPVLGAKPLNDTHWLSLAALHYVDPKLLDILPLYTNKFGTGTVDWRNIAVSDEDPKRKASIQRAVENAIITQQWHGGWPPREADITLFKWLAEGMKIH